MNIMKSMYIDRSIEFELVTPTKGTNHDVYDKRMTLQPSWPPFTYVPRFVYFYYVVLDAESKLQVKHYTYNMGPAPNAPQPWGPIPPAAMPDIVKHLALQARGAPGQGVELPEVNFEDILWVRRSYVAIFVDEADWEFHKRADQKAAVVFNVYKGSTPNHTFFDAEDLEIPMPTGVGGEFDNRTAIYFINHSKRDSQGVDLGDGFQPGDFETQDFVFEMYFNVNFADPGSAPMTVILDPGGTNQGPALLP